MSGVDSNSPYQSIKDQSTESTQFEGLYLDKIQKRD